MTRVCPECVVLAERLYSSSEADLRMDLLADRPPQAGDPATVFASSPWDVLVIVQKGYEGRREVRCRCCRCRCCEDE